MNANDFAGNVTADGLLTIRYQFLQRSTSTRKSLPLVATCTVYVLQIGFCTWHNKVIHNYMKPLAAIKAVRIL